MIHKRIRPQSSIATVIFLLFYHIISVTCQQCLSLGRSTTCDMFPTARISIRDANLVALPWLVNVSTVTEFDRQLLNYVNSTAFWNLELGCNSATIHNRARYAVSLTCATIVFNNKSSSACNPDTNSTLPLPLCQSSCESFSKSVEAILRSSSADSICNIHGGDLITAGGNSLSQQCKANEGLKGLPSTGCISAADHEISMCGFGGDLDTLCKYCNDYDSTLSCCREYDCLKSKTLNLSGGAIAGIVLGAVGGLVFCGCITFCILRKNQKKKKRSTYPNDFMHYRKGSKDITRMTSSYNISRSGSTAMMNNTPEAHMMRNVYPIEDEDYMEVLPDIHMNIDADFIKGHVFKVNSLEKQFVRVIYPFKSRENPDELELLKNDIIRMYYYFDDGWAFGDNFGTGLRGLFPILCVVNLTPEEVHELLYLSELSDEELQSVEGDEYNSSVRHFSTGVQYDLDPRATIRLQTLRRTLTFREKSHNSSTSQENNFHYLCAASNNNINSTVEQVPPVRTASMHATYNPRRSRILQDPLHMQEEDYFRSESSGSTAIANGGTPDSKSYLKGQ